ncbi:MAG: hypothetical protein IID32_12725 [Planctomycetes bacterium]|nr:hypothetical protein [Planctomycetota bacterium]
MSQAVNPKLIGAANEFVNNVFYGTMMREFRRSQGEGLFGNTPGGKIFMEQLDTELIRRMNNDKRVSPLAQALVDQLTRGVSGTGRKGLNHG